MKNTIKITNHRNTVMVAHRGVSGLETENTAAAFIAAGNRSYYGVETDIYRTSDGQYICNHDGKSGRICNEDLVMEQSTLADLRALVLNDKNGNPRFVGMDALVEGFARNGYSRELARMRIAVGCNG